MTELLHTELIEMRENVRRAVESLELCWRCQNVSECGKYILGNLVIVWLCEGCRNEVEPSEPPPRPYKKRKRPKQAW
ncbi:MAG: hypothetical protein A2722_02315 [Candidatus Doudnabacteria bacterium RIFCSPHIGHO2_01_FULL_50_11]|uniref:Uncharacterized protein n=1 Tax=Candidatus Doudnabacteria bacterium RIFCSPHIGHO2_01_FULL_50_11 TaxID=1817828 RepID=A0A1F5PFH6_9BACT|nr:MAG: hypothetical protein A2722_02315 [Candidatus Doudnabacteria bacterium RIFCSPHIGHO2_01_FULL_50_11]HLC44267.1 hypothetical protein [Patescibacteria group bacterium]